MPSIFNITPEDFELIDILGAGAWSEVWKAKWHKRGAGAIVAIKRIPVVGVTPELQQTIIQEVKIWKSLRHPNILSIYGACYAERERRELWIVVEYMDGGSLFDHLQAKKEISWDTRLKLAQQAAMSVHALHANNPCILHRDIKSLNLLVSKDLSTLKLTDFGMSVFRSVSSVGPYFSSREAVGTTRWRAPETFNSPATWSTQADIYSLGLVFYEIVTGKVPLYQVDDVCLVYRIREGYHPELPLDCPKELQAIIYKCCEKDPNSRPSSADLLDNLERVLSRSTNGAKNYNPGTPRTTASINISKSLQSLSYSKSRGVISQDSLNSNSSRSMSPRSLSPRSGTLFSLDLNRLKPTRSHDMGALRTYSDIGPRNLFTEERSSLPTYSPTRLQDSGQYSSRHESSYLSKSSYHTESSHHSLSSHDSFKFLRSNSSDSYTNVNDERLPFSQVQNVVTFGEKKSRFYREKLKFYDPRGIFLSLTDNCLYICDYSKNAITKCNLQGKYEHIKCRGIENPVKAIFYYKENLCFVFHGQSVTRINLDDDKDQELFVGTPSRPQFEVTPTGITIDQQTGTFFVAIRHKIGIIPQTGLPRLLAGNSKSGRVDATGGQAEFDTIKGICYNEMDSSLVVCDFGNNCIRRVTMEGQVSTICFLRGPEDVVVTSTGTILVATQSCIYRITHKVSGKYKPQILVGLQSSHKKGKDGTAKTCRFARIRGLVVHESSHSCFVLEHKYLRRVNFVTPMYKVNSLV